jgi:hypothetical protein
MKIEKINYKGWPNSYLVTNGEVELVITSDIGPRIMRFGFAGGQNLFKEFADGLGKSGEAEWQLRGGHRVWAAPEDPFLTYGADNGPVKIEIKGNVIEATQPVEPSSGLIKQLVVKMAPGGSGVEVLHRIRNENRWTIELAPWALTMMAQGGVGITGFPPRGTHPKDLPPTNPLVMWAYTDLSDSRWTFTKKYMMLRQDPKNASPQKLGHFNPKTWSAYLLAADLFIKRCSADPSLPYTDMGCSFETFTNDQILEQETLGPLVKLSYGAVVEHVERWTLHKNVRIAAWTDEELDKVLLPLISA